MSDWGGSRPGAGRKAIGDKPKVKRTFSLTDDNYNLVDYEAAKLDISKSEAIDRILTAVQNARPLSGLTDLSYSQKIEWLCAFWQYVDYSFGGLPDEFRKAKPGAAPPQFSFDKPKPPTEAAQPETLPLFPDESVPALSKAVDVSREALQNPGIVDNKGNLKHALNNRARAIYAVSEHATEAKTAGRHERAKKVIADSEALTEIKSDYDAAVAGVLALELVHLDLTWWPRMSEEQKRDYLRCAFQTWDSQ